MDMFTPCQAIIVLGTNIRRTPEGFAPTTYEDHDEYGFLAGEMNVRAARYLWEQAAAPTFVFSTGVSQKTKRDLGEQAPTEASVYSAAFRQQLAEADLAEPQIILEEQSVNTHSNLIEVFSIIRQQGWRHVTVLSARYHIPRVEALSHLIRKKQPLPGVRIDFAMAEDIVMLAAPGVYDQQIIDAYDSEQGQKRLMNEQNGLRDMQEGRYVITEFQLQS
jgi:hypothetical protein